MNKEKKNGLDLNRRRFVQGLSSGGVLASLGLMSNNVFAAKNATHEVPVLNGPTFDMTIDSWADAVSFHSIAFTCHSIQVLAPMSNSRLLN